ncbi:MAG TPA: lipase maturation factor family protein [Gemmatimonadales bacterium]|nr:lipase maturation factor family protein [Gemmatimonadales bacterium]
MSIRKTIEEPFEWITGIDAGARYEIARWVFLRALAAVFLIAFFSFWVQVQGLIGPAGILPAGEFLDAVRSHLGLERYWLLPTVFWLGAGRAALHLVSGLGVLSGFALLLDFHPRPALVSCWVLYLSLAVVGQDFLSFQWDVLLLETGLLAVLLVPGPRGRSRRSPPAVGLALLWFLLFRLLFESGVVKLTSGDPTWRNLTALHYHFFTQPLPTWTAWYANLLPEWMKSAGVIATFTIELGAPWLILLGRVPRLVAFAATVLLQMMIGGTGNYTFFNILTVALALLLIDDSVWRRILPAGFVRGAIETPEKREEAVVAEWLRVTAGTVLFVLALGTLWDTVFGYGTLPGVDSALRWAGPLESVNGYGLFRVMTTDRLEIEVEGSDNGVTWRPYEFRYKPQDVSRRPSFVEPHQPRLDWQMWFAALGTVNDSAWFQRFLERLLEGSPDVLSLLRSNPFPDHPPRFVRAQLYRYRFSTAAERRASGDWWVRSAVGSFAPPVALPAVGSP